MAPSWRLAYEKPGETNYVTEADNPTAIRVELERSGDQWCGKVVNGEPGATVTALEIYSDDRPVDTENDLLYVPWEDGARIKVWPKPDMKFATYHPNGASNCRDAPRAYAPGTTHVPAPCGVDS